ncbi:MULTISPECIES: DUF1672 family protein [Bacillaceae]|uniref:DUF1672 domain-containing protein n=1 Tax=Evansella alkalicola TaxID=745819 RepID=A0ABS6JQ52_9BACI|nr:MULTISPECIES: DUF1672 family protein [Bacillaceae]MBU9720565.1 DUF1672 domain-containing protein [Bacillus alkalicola]
MKMKSIILAISLLVSLMIGGCEVMDEITETPEEKHFREAYVSVNEYTGEEKDLPDGQRNDPIAKEKFDEIAEATHKFFLEKYKTEVIVHNAVGAKHGIMVFVESPNEPKFHTFAMMPVDAKEEKIFPDNIWTVENTVERDIFTGILAMIMEDEIMSLDKFFIEIKEKYPVVGFRQEAINNATYNGYTTPYYFISHLFIKEEYQPINQLYFSNPEISKEELKKQFDKLDHDAENLSFVINLFMNEPDMQPNDAIFQQIISDIEKREGLPKGRYSLFLHDNNINKYSGMGDKDNSLQLHGPNRIVRRH